METLAEAGLELSNRRFLRVGHFGQAQRLHHHFANSDQRRIAHRWLLVTAIEAIDREDPVVPSVTGFKVVDQVR